MAGTGRIQETSIECPFCEKGKVKTLHKESYLQGQESHISAGSKTTYSRKPEKYEVLEDCPKCGKSKKEIQKYLDGKQKKEADPEKVKKRMKEAGLPTKLEFNIEA